MVAINKIDILESEEDLQRVLAFVSENARALLGTAPDTFPVAARLALRTDRPLLTAGPVPALLHVQIRWRVPVRQAVLPLV